MGPREGVCLTPGLHSGSSAWHPSIAWLIPLGDLRGVSRAPGLGRTQDEGGLTPCWVRTPQPSRALSFTSTREPPQGTSMFHASPESRPPTEKWSGSGAGVIYIHNQARGSGDPWGEREEGGRPGGQGCWPGCDHRHGTGRGPAQRGLQNPLWPVGKEGLSLVVPEAHTGPHGWGCWELWTRVMAGCPACRCWRTATSGGSFGIAVARQATCPATSWQRPG